MGMNWGAFAGAAAQSGMSTYERIEAQKLKDLQKQQLEKDIAEKEALDTAWRNSQARVGQQDDFAQAIKTGGGAGTQQAQMLSNQGALAGNTPEDQAFERASAESAAGAMRQNAVAQGAIPADQSALPAMSPTEYTSKQGMADYVKAASQVSRKGTLEALQLKNVVREADNQDKFDEERTKLNDTLARIQGTAESGGLKGLYEAGAKEGLKLKFVEGKNGVGSRIQVLGPKGDVLETVSDVASATQKLSQAAMQQFMDKSIGFLGSADKVISAMQKSKEISIKEQDVAINKEYKGIGGVIDRAYQSGGKGGGGSNTTQRIMEQAEALAKDKNSKFFGKKEDAYQFLKRGFTRDEDQLKWNEIEAGLRKREGITPQEIEEQRAGWFGPQRGYAPPQAVQVLQSGIDPKTGNTLSDDQLNEFNRKFPKTPWQDILGPTRKPQPPTPTQQGGIPVPQ